MVATRHLLAHVTPTPNSLLSLILVPTNPLRARCVCVCQVATDVALGVSHYWDIINLSADAHPIHLHNVDFEVSK